MDAGVDGTLDAVVVEADEATDAEEAKVGTGGIAPIGAPDPTEELPLVEVAAAG